MNAPERTMLPTRMQRYNEKSDWQLLCHKKVWRNRTKTLRAGGYGQKNNDYYCHLCNKSADLLYLCREAAERSHRGSFLHP